MYYTMLYYDALYVAANANTNTDSDANANASTDTTYTADSVNATTTTTTTNTTDTNNDTDTANASVNKHSSREEHPLEYRLLEHRHRGWIAVSAAGCRAGACAKGVFLFHRHRC